MSSRPKFPFVLKLKGGKCLHWRYNLLSAFAESKLLIYYQDSKEKLLTTTALLHSVKSMSTRENTTPINQKSRKIVLHLINKRKEMPSFQPKRKLRAFGGS